MSSRRAFFTRRETKRAQYDARTRKRGNGPHTDVKEEMKREIWRGGMGRWEEMPVTIKGRKNRPLKRCHLERGRENRGLTFSRDL